jgi:hypothetical protein
MSHELGDEANSGGVSYLGKGGRELGGILRRCVIITYQGRILALRRLSNRPTSMVG